MVLHMVHYAPMIAKLGRLTSILSELNSIVVAFSGGIDSTLLLYLAKEALGENVIAITAVSPSLSTADKDETEKLARHMGVQHIFIESTEAEDQRYLDNSPERCYFCKNDVYTHIIAYAHEHGYHYVIDGTNADDVGDHRPGRKAARQHGVRSPLQEAEITKVEIRTLAEQYGLPNWDKPAAACLASRVPYGTTITLESLSQIDQAEAALREMGFGQLRVRHHQQVARIEVDANAFESVLQKREKIVSSLTGLGYAYVSLDLAGFRSGSMNEVLVDGVRGKGDS
jgi:pyridinium-3,5-biscarboxylic acid mononucleotide sulfurtransferase